MTNEEKLIKELINRDSNIHKISESVKKQFNVDTTFNSETAELTLESENTIDVIKAKRFIEENYEDGMFNIVV